MAEDVQAILTAAPLMNSVKADAWDAYHDASNLDDLTARLNKLPIPQSVKADLWDAKSREAAPVTTQPKTTPQPVTISADTSNPVTRWAQNVMDDIRYGTDTTGVGSVLKGLGAHGVQYGAPEKVGEFMASIPLGLAGVVKGGGEVASGDLGKGAKDVASGAIQAVQMPAAFAGGPELDATAGAAAKAIGKTAEAASSAASAIKGVIPNAERVHQNFSQVMKAAGDLPININEPGNAALRIRALADAGASMPKVASDFIRRIEDFNKGPVTYSEARDFYSNASRLSGEEMSRLTPNMRRLIGDFTNSLNNAISATAGQVGKLEQYQNAMQEYHRLMQLRSLSDAAKEALTGKVAQTLGLGALGGYVAKKLFE